MLLVLGRALGETYEIQQQLTPLGGAPAIPTLERWDTEWTAGKYLANGDTRYGCGGANDVSGAAAD